MSSILGCKVALHISVKYLKFNLNKNQSLRQFASSYQAHSMMSTASSFLTQEKSSLALKTTMVAGVTWMRSSKLDSSQ